MRIVNLLALICASFFTYACVGPCPDGFLRDNNGNCIEIGGDDDDERQNEGTGGNGNAGSGDNTGGANNGGSSSAGSGTVTLHVVNTTGDDICWIYADTCGQLDSPDYLEDIGSLPDGWYLSITGLVAACYDLYAEDCYTDSWYWSTPGVQIASEFTWTLTP